jgi:hypothetical protein
VVLDIGIGFQGFVRDCDVRSVGVRPVSVTETYVMLHA